MPRSPRSPRRRQPKLLLRDYVSPDQAALQVITNAIHAALEYSPSKAAPHPPHDDVYAYVSREIERRFWSDVYVERPEIHDILFTLETGRLVLIEGERGTGKSTAIRAVVHELDGATSASDGVPDQRAAGFLPYVFDANAFTEDLQDEASVSETIHREIYGHFDRKITDRASWMAFLYEHHPAFERFRFTLHNDGFVPSETGEWMFLANDAAYTALIQAGIEKFSDTAHSARLRFLLEYVATNMAQEPLIIIDNVDHLTNSVVRRCGMVLASIMGSSPRHRLRGAIAVRPESADLIQHVLDTAMRPSRVSMTRRPLAPDSYDEPPVYVTLNFLKKRIAVLREPATREVIIDAVDTEAASRLAEAVGLAPDGVDSFLGSVLELLDLLVFNVFSATSEDSSHNQDWELVRAVHFWHNGSLRESAYSLTTFASDILQDKTHTYELHDLLRLFAQQEHEDEEEARARRRRLQRITRSLLYRHLLFWAAPPDALRPLRNVMVFDGVEESTDPPIHFLRLRLLQYLSHAERGRATVGKIRYDIRRLGVDEERIDEALRELAVKRSHDDGGLVRIDRFSESGNEAPLKTGAMVQLLDAGRFLVDTLYVTTEYLFWSALTTPNLNPGVRVPASITSDDIQSDEFRTAIAARFLEKHLVERFCDEHPYLRGYSERWTPANARQRLKLYKNLFGFSEQNWFLDRAINSVVAFMPLRDPAGEFAEAREAIERVRRHARSLDRVMKTAASR